MVILIPLSCIRVLRDAEAQPSASRFGTKGLLVDGYCSGFPKEQAGMLENRLGYQGTGCFNKVRRSGYAGTLLEVNVSHYQV